MNRKGEADLVRALDLDDFTFPGLAGDRFESPIIPIVVPSFCEALLVIDPLLLLLLLFMLLLLRVDALWDLCREEADFSLRNNDGMFSLTLVTWSLNSLSESFCLRIFRVALATDSGVTMRQEESGGGIGDGFYQLYSIWRREKREK